MNDKQLRKQKKTAARHEREEKQARTILFGVVGALILLGVILIIGCSLL